MHPMEESEKIVTEEAGKDVEEKGKGKAKVEAKVEAEVEAKEEPKSMDILIYGAGAIGSFMGYILGVAADGGDGIVENVALLGREDHIRAIRGHGLQIDSVDLADAREVISFRHCFSSLDELKASGFDPEIVIVCVKTRSLKALSLELERSGLMQDCLKGATFILLMNGMGNKEAFGCLGVADNRLFEGITSIGVRFAEDGRIELKGRGKSILDAQMDCNKKEFLRQRFSEMGLEIEFSYSFKEHQYGKLFVNAVINPITALTRQSNSIVLSPKLSSTVKAVISEAVSVATAEGIAVDEPEVTRLVSSVAERTAANTSSMLQDVLKGRPTEIEAINGYIIARAEEHGIKTPVNRALFELVRAATEQ